VTALLELDAPSAEPAWQVERRYVEIGGVRRPLRLVRFATGWLASVDTIEGPTLGADRSPYLAARRALEPLGIGLAEAMSLVGRIGGG
jgi:hypothetical protein